MVYRILVASYTDAVYTLLFDPLKAADESLSLLSKLTVGHHPSWIERHPSDPAIIFAGLEQEDGRLLTLRYNIGIGEGQILADVSSRGADPCSILAMHENIFVANYSSSSIGIFNLPSTEHPERVSESQSPLHFSGNGPCSERQASSHPHQVYFAKRESAAALGPTDEILVPDLGSDKVWRLYKNAEGKWEKKNEITYNQHLGGGPRHVVVHESKLYTLLELAKKITVHDFRTSTSNPPLLAEAVLPAPDDLKPLTMLAAEILCPPPNPIFPDAYIYVSNRNDPRPHGDLISIFSVHKDGQMVLERIGDVPTGLAHVRGFLFFGPDDRYVVVGGANGGGVKVFERIDRGRSMREVAHLPASDGGAGLAPTAFLVL
ncbi:hypothetical protein ACEPAF_5447 [Sanghuangporus sanghuang]